MNVKGLEIDTKRGIIRKTIRYLSDYDKAHWEQPGPDTYERLVVGSTEFLSHRSWNLRPMLPHYIKSWVEKAPYPSDDYQAVIEMSFIEGQPLSSFQDLPQDIAIQLASFIEGSTTMAATTHKETGKILLPDLLGGIVHPHDRFQNFLVETATGKLFFVDTYPLARIPGRRLIPRKLDFIGVRAGYVRHLDVAAQATGRDNVVSKTRQLIYTLQDS